MSQKSDEEEAEAGIEETKWNYVETYVKLKKETNINFCTEIPKGKN